MTAIERAGHPVVRIGVKDVSSLGGEFFRWEIAVAGYRSRRGIRMGHVADLPWGTVQFAVARLFGRIGNWNRIPDIQGADEVNGMERWTEWNPLFSGSGFRGPPERGGRRDELELPNSLVADA